ncbi:SEL1-like repeat protein [Vibrio penaeicida]|uniref:Sel1 repeat family protein n=1 Tax=Vibrio penaeicida TaxID=104609 RepID=A0AAV5NYD7_9VIBR|nr:hypothetical protein [Vibrio penaeicida]RTZ23161.1 hypothetical protein EKN09_10405 [Vibrio penaeicida]GLQ75032.1 hypothetical protein GCM10007932_43940 [Vibrio penaeicida]
MKYNIKKIVMNTIITTIVFVFLFLAFMYGRKYYKDLPTEFKINQLENSHVYSRLLNSREYVGVTNKDPYISSAYRPGDKLYEPLLAVQQGRWDEAQELLEPLVMAGDTTAMFWLAEINYSTGAFSGTYGATLFKKAAKLGNPYAALKLDGDNEECQRFMGRHCSKEWGDLAEKLLEERAANGDYKARFALSRYRGWNSKEDFNEAVEVVIESAKNHYFRPLMEVAFPYYDASDIERTKIENDLLRFILHHNYPRAILMLHYGEREFSDEYKKEIYEKYMLLVGNKDLAILDYYGENYRNDRDKLIYSLAFSMLSNTYKNEYGGKVRTWEFEHRYLDSGDKFTEEEINKAKSLFEEMKSTSTPVIYIDEIEPRKYL